MFQILPRAYKNSIILTEIIANKHEKVILFWEFILLTKRYLVNYFN